MVNLYTEAANIVKQVKGKRGSVKTLVFSSAHHNKKSLYALVCESLKYYEVLSELLERTSLMKYEKSLKNNVELGVVLLYEHLLGRGLTGKVQDGHTINSGYHAEELKWLYQEIVRKRRGKLTQGVVLLQHIIKKHKSSIHSHCELMKVKAGVTGLKELIRGNPIDSDLSLPKYVRVNTIKTNTEDVIKEFEMDGWSHLECSKESFKDVVCSLDRHNFTTDPHIPDLLVFPATTDLHTNKMFVAGEIILQDKASCFPACLLSPPPGSHLIDCCAAPGNKTSHLAAILGNRGKIFAFDKDVKRLTTLENMMKKVGATCVEAKCKDFLSVNPSDGKYRDVEYILVDPSCSGTGMVNRMSHQLKEEEISEERLEQLSKFQMTILKHAFKFPNVKRIMYSTCSIHEKENEQVVEEVMLAVSHRFRMRLLMPDWPERGVKGYEHAQYCLRMSCDSALTNGFFIACFERKEDTETKLIVSEKCERVFNEVSFDQDISENSRQTAEDKQEKTRQKLKRKQNSGSHTSDGVTNGDTELLNKITNGNQPQKDCSIDGEIEGFGKDGNHKRGNNCKKKRKKSKQRDRLAGTNKGEKQNDILEYRHTNSCKKKRKKSKQRDVIPGETHKEKTNTVLEHEHHNACRKKRKRSKDRDSMENKSKEILSNTCTEERQFDYCNKERKKSKVIDHTEVEQNQERIDFEHRHTNSCKKKRKKSKQRDILVENHVKLGKTRANYEHKHSNSRKKKRKKSKQSLLKNGQNDVGKKKRMDISLEK